MGPFRLQWRPRSTNNNDLADDRSRLLLECDNLQLALDKRILSSEEECPVEKRLERFWNDSTQTNRLSWGTFSEFYSSTDENATLIDASNIYFRDDTNYENDGDDDERDNVSLLKGMLREEHMEEEKQDNFDYIEDDEIDLLSGPKAAFGGRNLSYNLETLDSSSLGDDEDDEIFLAYSPISAASLELLLVPPTDPEVVASLKEQEESQSNSPRHQQPQYRDEVDENDAVAETAGKARLHDKLQAQNKAAARRRAVAKRLHRDRPKYGVDFSSHLTTVKEINSEDERTSVGSGMSGRPRPPAITTLILEFETPKTKRSVNNKIVSIRTDTTSRTASTSSSYDPTCSISGEESI